MHQAKVNRRTKRVGVKPANIDADVVKELMTTMRQMQQDQSRVIEQMLIAQQKQSDVMAAWIGMFKPPDTPNQTTGLDQRLLAREAAAESTDWEPMDPEEMMEIVKMVGTGS